MSKRVLVRRGKKVLNLLFDEQKLIECTVNDTMPPLLGSIFVARVENIVRAINGAFLKAGDIRLYYSLEQMPPLFIKQSREGQLTVGDELVIQVSREAIKTKEPSAAASIELPGRYCVVIRSKSRGVKLLFSKKICDDGFKEEIKAAVLNVQCDSVEILVRTNAVNVPVGETAAEIKKLCMEYNSIISSAPYREAGFCLYKPQADFISAIRDTCIGSVTEVVSDDEGLLDDVRKALADVTELPNFSLYKSDYPIDKCFGIDLAIGKALEKHVWLDSGAYLVIEKTEALTAIDVNTGKSAAAARRATNSQDFYFAVNSEAAIQVMRQIRLRNLSGIILVDFINMQREGDKKALLDKLRVLAKSDPVDTKIVDMTALGLVEITRKKVRETLDRQLETC